MLPVQGFVVVDGAIERSWLSNAVPSLTGVGRVHVAVRSVTTTLRSNVAPITGPSGMTAKSTSCQSGPLLVQSSCCVVPADEWPCARHDAPDEHAVNAMRLGIHPRSPSLGVARAVRRCPGGTPTE